MEKFSFFMKEYVNFPTDVDTEQPGNPSLAGACWAQTEFPSGCGAASPSQVIFLL